MIDENDYSITEPAEGERNSRRTSISARNRKLLIIIGAVVLVGVTALFLWPRHERANKKGNSVEGKASEEDTNAGNEVVLSPTALASAGIEIVGVTERPAVALLRVTGAVEPNQQETQQVTPLIAGRVVRVNVVVGDHVRRRDACGHLKP